MRFQFDLRRTGALLLVCSAFACVGDDAAQSGGFRSGLQRDRQVSQLTTQELQTLCTAVSDSALTVITRESQLRLVCAATVVGTSLVPNADGTLRLDVKTCEAQRDVCVAEIEKSGRSISSVMLEGLEDCSDVAQVQASAAGCNATVAEYEACVEERFAIARTGVERLDCAYLAEELVSTDSETMEVIAQESEPPSPACEAFERKCPDAA